MGLYLAGRRPLVAFCLLFFLVNHAVESSIIALELIYEHRNYLPSMTLYLLAALGSHAGVAIENARIYAEKEKVSALLHDALIPRRSLGFPGLVLGHRFLPSRDLSGDYYDLIPLGPRRCGLVIGDVSGKGPEAAIQTIR
ncbi:MAG: hypothetical protein EOM24_18360, partial [Chloroflexia bacterium]|nr:hypothetical protein [Chloroflexia bacterium]